MAKLRRVSGLLAEYDDGSRHGISCVAPGEDIEKLLGREPPADPVFDVGEGADGQAAAIPNWASWTEAEVLAWLELNVEPEIGTTAPHTYTAIKAMARMIVAIRNKTWPQLEGS